MFLSYFHDFSDAIFKNRLKTVLNWKAKNADFTWFKRFFDFLKRYLNAFKQFPVKKIKSPWSEDFSSKSERFFWHIFFCSFLFFRRIQSEKQRIFGTFRTFLSYSSLFNRFKPFLYFPCQSTADCCQDGVLNDQDTTALMQFIILLIDDLPVQPTEK